LPAASEDVVNTACCEPPTAAVPSVWLVVRSKNVTVPVGVTPPALPETVAVNVTGWFNALGFGEDVSVVAVPAGTMFMPVRAATLAGKIGIVAIIGRSDANESDGQQCDDKSRLAVAHWDRANCRAATQAYYNERYGAAWD
jgi:hypothetical protein